MEHLGEGSPEVEQQKPLKAMVAKEDDPASYLGQTVTFQESFLLNFGGGGEIFW